ncbi:MAG: T9SS type A sorting domain-containing protein, partial [Bacteroidales bacterium]|nr:T9SS type A sorting domain-containing protein [Bacteroidales bacterium]
IVGQVVQTIENPTEVQTISIANYTTGVYMVTLFDNNGNSTTQRFIKQ